MIYDPASKKMQSFPNEFVRLLLTRKPKNDSNQYRFWKRTITCSFIIRQEQQIVKVFYFHALGIIENSLQKSENFMQKHKPLPLLAAELLDFLASPAGLRFWYSAWSESHIAGGGCQSHSRESEDPLVIHS